ncbi:MAG TPA: hypothetical protein VFV99_11285 [Kofleriaceae bacterium]|nr:hypothetical protein [Kofleriaceae bacterium]
MRSWLSLALVLAACGTEVPAGDGSGSGSGSDDEQVDPSVCDTSYLDYDNFGAPFVINWCRGCHSDAVPAGMRQKAPLDANFDTLAQVRTWSQKIATRATGTTPNMPPAGGPTEQERQLLAEWLACGAK